MKKYRVYGVVHTTKYIGEFEADNVDDATEMAWNSEEVHISLCHHCANEVDELEIRNMIVEEVEE